VSVVQVGSCFQGFVWEKRRWNYSLTEVMFAVGYWWVTDGKHLETSRIQIVDRMQRN
jgi:hypothetical protein